ncbi:hypothetical protein ACHAXS_014244 [Conticribra weissflogii]
MTSNPADDNASDKPSSSGIGSAHQQKLPPRQDQPNSKPPTGKNLRSSNSSNQLTTINGQHGVTIGVGKQEQSGKAKIPNQGAPNNDSNQNNVSRGGQGQAKQAHGQMQINSGGQHIGEQSNNTSIQTIQQGGQMEQLVKNENSTVHQNNVAQNMVQNPQHMHPQSTPTCSQPLVQSANIQHSDQGAGQQQQQYMHNLQQQQVHMQPQGSNQHMMNQQQHFQQQVPNQQYAMNPPQTVPNQSIPMPNAPQWHHQQSQQDQLLQNQQQAQMPVQMQLIQQTPNHQQPQLIPQTFQQLHSHSQQSMPSQSQMNLQQLGQSTQAQIGQHHILQQQPVPVLGIQQHLIQSQQITQQNTSQIYHQTQLQQQQFNPQPQHTPPAAAPALVSASPSKAVKKGRFRVVKGAKCSKNGENANPNASTNDAGAGEATGAVVGVGIDTASEQSNNNGNTGNAILASDVQGGNEANVVAPVVSTKKVKGRFVITTGGGSVVSSVSAGTTATACTVGATNVGLGASTLIHTPNANPEESTLSTVASNPSIVQMPPHLMQPTLPQQMLQPPVTSQFSQMQPSLIQMPMHIPLATLSPVQVPSQTMGLVDVNGQIMAISAAPAPNHQLHIPSLQPGQQPSIQHPFPVAPPQIQGQQMFANSVQSMAPAASMQPLAFAAPPQSSNIGEISQQIHPQPPQPQPIPSTQPQENRSVKETIPGATTTNSSIASNASKPRVAGTSGTNLGAIAGTRVGAGGNPNGRLIGTGAIGKLLHNMECLRVEVVEADKSLTSLKSDNRFLRDKNKELEGKNQDLERRLAEEKSLREALDIKYRNLRQKVREQQLLESNHSLSADASQHRNEHRPPAADTSVKTDSHFKENEQVGQEKQKKSGPALGMSATQKMDQPTRLKDEAREIESKKSLSVEGSPDLKSVPSVDAIRAIGKVDGEKPSTQLPMPHMSENNPTKGPSTAGGTQNNSVPPKTVNDQTQHTGGKAYPTPLNPMAPQQLAGQSSLARQYDPMRAIVQDFVSSSNHAVVSPPAMTSMVGVNDGSLSIPLIVTSQTNHEKTSLIDGRILTPVNLQSTMTKHFDPLGTPTNNGDRPIAVGNFDHPQINGFPLNVDPLQSVSSHSIQTMTHLNGGNVTMPVIVPLPLTQSSTPQTTNSGLAPTQYQQQYPQQHQHHSQQQQSDPFSEIFSHT